MDRLRREGTKISDGWITLYAAEREDGLPHRRLGIRVAKRAGNAPARSRLRRLVREIFRQGKDKLAPSLDLLVLILPFDGAKKLKYGELEKKWDALTSRFQTRASSL